MLCLYAAHAATMQTQEPLKKADKPKKTALLNIINCWHWLYTTEIAVGNPPKYFKAIIDTASSDVMVPSANCTEPEYRRQHPLYNSSESFTYIPDGTPARVANGLYYSWGNGSIDSYYVGSIEVKHQTFEEAIIVHPSYFFPESWHDIGLALSRKVVYNDKDSNLHVPSPFQNMVKQGVLEEDMFSLKLPRKVHETGFLLLGARGDDYDAQSAIQLPLIERAEGARGDDEELYRSGGWEVEPVYLHFGAGEDEIYYDLHGYAAAFTTWPPFLLFPQTFTEWIWDRIAIPGYDTIKCKDVTPALPNITVALRGIGGSIKEFVLDYEDYATDIWRFPGLRDGDCQLPLGGLEENPDGPKYILLGPQFLRRHYTTFDEGRKSIFCRC